MGLRRRVAALKRSRETAVPANGHRALILGIFLAKGSKEAKVRHRIEQIACFTLRWSSTSISTIWVSRALFIFRRD